MLAEATREAAGGASARQIYHVMMAIVAMAASRHAGQNISQLMLRLVGGDMRRWKPSAAAMAREYM